MKSIPPNEPTAAGCRAETEQEEEMKRITYIIIAAMALVSSVACQGSADSEENAAPTNNGQAANAQVATDVTYHADVRPILESNCTSCHLGEGAGIAPFGLTTFEEVKPLAGLLAESTTDRRMPPWPPSQECAELEHPRVLSDADIATIAEWAEAGAPEGDPADWVEPAEVAEEERPEPDLTIDIGTDYKPNPPVEGEIDDYRCFLVEADITQDVWLNAHVTRPSNLQVAHHMLMHAVPADQIEAVRARAEAEPGPGYTCFGGPQVRGSDLLGGWVPGSVGSAHPPGHGIRIPAGSAFVIQMHYNIVSDPEGTDRTEIDLHFTDGQPERQLALYSMAEPGLFIPAGATDDVETTEFELQADVEVFSIAPHMHLLGTSTRAWAVGPDGDETCLIDIPKWDFSWQGFYATKEPVRLEKGSTVHVECTYDNSPENQPAGRAPREVTWGDGTYDEMCVTYFVLGI